VLILGIDPGSRYTGYGFLRRHGQRLEAVQFGRLSTSTGGPLAVRLGTIAADLEELLADLPPAAVAIESTFLGMNPRSLVVLSQARGALLGVVGRRDIEVFEYTPAEVKSAVTGNGRADKDQVARMVRRILQLPDESVSADATDALAIAICCAHRYALATVTGVARV
jgi:crossover junction endodeoxyribonuclease RuvC